MSHSKYLDNLTADEKNALRAKLWGIQNHKCFICEKEIDLDLNSVNIDHIKPLANGGKDEEQNFALTHEKTCYQNKTIYPCLTPHSK
jgi:5-methylcytosine-specific restriction endonuclease McrA